ncbi:MAG: DUF5662 family protein [Candidatus Cloacimonetes bacterium]|nr:DUF5662 family protein [Candidatus Cloacimonadota bacterium]
MEIKLEVLTDILIHISEVQENLAEMTAILKARGITHDRSKLEAIEFDAFVKTRPKFKQANYGSTEYQKCVDMIKPSIDHHYANNRHHTAFHKNGFADMNLFDILEMLADWKAAARRSPDLSFEDSLPIAFKKYNIPQNMQQHIVATIISLGWREKHE